ncbi:MAG: hypothetical protein AAFN07_12805 [Pseudomonadota bacterium]
MENPLVAIVVLVFIAICLGWAFRQRIATQIKVGFADFASIAKALDETGRDGSFAAFVFDPKGSDTKDSLNIQFSKEDGVVGFDWVLLCDINIRDRDKLEALALAKGVSLEFRTMNDVDYLRTESEGFAEFPAEILVRLYGCEESQKVTMIQEGFEWNPDSV